MNTLRKSQLKKLIADTIINLTISEGFKKEEVFSIEDLKKIIKLEWRDVTLNKYPLESERHSIKKKRADEKHRANASNYKFELALEVLHEQLPEADVEELTFALSVARLGGPVEEPLPIGFNYKEFIAGLS